MKQEILPRFQECMSEKLLISIDEIINCKSILKPTCGDNKQLIFAHLNINSVRNKFDLLTEKVAGNIDVLMIRERKIDESFPVGNFLLPEFSVPYRSDHDSKGGGILLYAREDIPSNLLSIENKLIEGFYIELNFHKNKWLVNCSYNPHKSSTDNRLLALSDP